MVSVSLFGFFLFLEKRICTQWKRLESNENRRTELILRARKAKGGLSSFSRSFGDYAPTEGRT